MEALFDASGITRRVQSCCGGLVELKGTFLHDPRNLSHASSGGLNGVYPYPTEPPQEAIVQFLHQTVKEFVGKTENLDFLFDTALEEAASSKPEERGHDFILWSYWYWLNISKIPPKQPGIIRYQYDT